MSAPPATPRGTTLGAEPFSGLDGLAARAEELDRLVAAAGLDELGNGSLWTLAHARAHAGDALFGWTLRDAAGEVAGQVAFRPEPPRGPLALRRALLVQDGTFDSDYLDLPVLPGAETPAVEALLDALAARPGLEAVVLAGLPDDSPRLAALRAALSRRGWPRRESAVPCCAAPLPATFDAYLAGLKKRMRTKVRSALRRADELGADLVWTERAEDVPRDLEGLYRLHAMRWEERGEPGSFADPARRAFYAELTPALLERGALRLARLEVDGRPVAYQYGAVLGGTYSQLQEGFDTAHASDRVATALRALCVRSFVEDEGLASYDFLAGVTRHKTDWGAVPRPCTTVGFALPRWRARLAFAAADLRDRLRGGRPDA